MTHARVAAERNLRIAAEDKRKGRIQELQGLAELHIAVLRSSCLPKLLAKKGCRIGNRRVYVECKHGRSRA